MEDCIARAEHEEFAKRIDAENTRQNRRIEALEQSVDRFGRIASSVERLATNMEGMLKEQERQGERLDKLEERLNAEIVGQSRAVAAVAGGTAGQAGRQARRKLERYGKKHTGRHQFCHRRGAGCGHCYDVDQIRRNTYESY